MNNSKNKFLLVIVVLLFIANVASIALFWLSKPKRPQQPQESPAAFLIKELKLSTSQQLQFEKLRREHIEAATPLREEIKNAKEVLFNMLKTAGVADSVKNRAAKNISSITEKLDLVTYNHFEKVRAICTAQQQQRFDEIIKEVIGMISQDQSGMPGQRPPPLNPPGDEGLPPPGDRPPPPNGN